MNLCEEYLSRHHINIPFARHNIYGDFFPTGMVNVVLSFLIKEMNAPLGPTTFVQEATLLFFAYSDRVII